jgi:hypothetical protein
MTADQKELIEHYIEVRAILINYGGTIRTVEDKDCLEIWQDSASSGVYYRLDPAKSVIPVEDTLLFTPIYSIISISFKKDV